MRALLSAGMLLASLAAAESPPSCGPQGSHPLSAPEAAGRRLALERDLAEGALTHCGYFLRRACGEWESGLPGLRAFEMAHRFCDEAGRADSGGDGSAKAIAMRGRVAARLSGEDYAGAFAAWKAATAGGGGDSAAVAPFAEAVHAGLSLTDFPAQGPEAYRLGPGPFHPDRIVWASLVPGAGFWSLGEGRLAAQHFLIGSGLTAVTIWRLWSGYRAADHADRMVACLDAGVLFLLWKRYYVGGMREAGRLARLKNRRHGAARVRSLWSSEDPFAPPARPGERGG